jgi:hypothetical protein
LIKIDNGILNPIRLYYPHDRRPEETLEAAKTAKPMPEHREQQRRSFVYGNTHFENELITREMVDREAEKLAKDKK